MHPILFKFGFLTVYTYGVFVFLGVLAGYLVCKHLASKEGINQESFSSIIFWTIIFAFLGAKLLYVLLEFKNFLHNPLRMLRSGFVFYGGIVSGFSCLYFLSKKHKINFRKLLDTIAVGAPLAHAFGRIGCFFYGCCYPTQLISSFFLFLIFLALLFIRKRKKFNGQVFLAYIFIYSIFRFIIEFFRSDPRGHVFFLSTSQFISLILIPISIFLVFRWNKAS